MINEETIQQNTNRLNAESKAAPSFRKYGWALHLIAWGVLCGFPLIFSVSSRSEQPVTWDLYARFFIMLLSIMVMFYANYSFLVKRYLFTKKTGKFILINVGLIFLMIFAVHFFMELLPEPPMKPQHPDRPPREKFFLGFIFWNSMVYVFTIALSVAFRSTTSWYMVEEQRKDLERSRSEAELQNLKSQLNPHFLFNTLNNIYSLIAISPEKGQDAIHELSRLLRYVMHDSSQPFVPLEKELSFISNYVELMRLRLPEHVQLDTSVSCEKPNQLIAPLLFISLIENAFKHGVSNNKPSFIYIDIHQEKNEVVCDILNSDFPKDNETDKSGSGIGLVNLRKRLSLLYPGNYRFHCGKEGENYRSYLSITVNDAAL